MRRSLEHEDVVQVRVAVRLGEVRGAGQQGGGLLDATSASLWPVVAQHELLVKDGLVEVGLDVDRRLQQRRRDASVLREAPLACGPLPAPQRLLLGLACIWSRRLRKLLLAQVVLLEHELYVDATPAGVEDRLRDRLRVELLHRDVKRRAGGCDEVDDRPLDVVWGVEVLGPRVCLDLPAREARHA